MNVAFLSLGGNIGERLAYINEAKRLISGFCGNILMESGIYETQAWGIDRAPDYYNQCLKIQTGLGAEALLFKLLEIEKEMGRVRTGNKNENRPIDIDILLFNNEVIKSECCEVPHPRMHLRLFVLKPLNEIAGSEIHPVLKQTISELQINCADTLEIKKLLPHVHLC